MSRSDLTISESDELSSGSEIMLDANANANAEQSVELRSTRRAWIKGGLGSVGVLGAGFGAGWIGALPTAEAIESKASSRLGGSQAALPDFGDPDVNLRQIVRMQGSLREEDVPWWFTGVIFGVRGERETPRPLVRFEGLEVYWFAHTSTGFQLGGHTVTFFRDYETREFLYEFKNPYTGRVDEVKPAVQGGNLGFSYSREGIWPVRLDGTPFGEPRRAPLQLQWHAMGEHVWMQHQTVYPPGMPPMHGQRQTMFAQRRDVLDQRREALPSTFSSTVFMGWLKWMNMKDEPGHVIWHASGAKLQSLAELPREYLARAEKEFPDRLSAKPKPIRY